jgi:glucose/arabinose dehydrogenase
MSYASPPGLFQRLYLPLVQQGQAGTPLPYRIPRDNPFVGQSGYRHEIWALGLRNPWRFSFDRQNGDLYIADVGQNAWEEVDFQPASSSGGENYGWDVMEGTHCYEPSSGCDTRGLTLPVFEYYHHQSNVEDCSVTGGFVYRGSQFPTMQGVYFLGDFCSGKIWGLQRQGNTWQSVLLKDSPYNISSFGEDQDGELYVVAYDGAIYQITAP